MFYKKLILLAVCGLGILAFCKTGLFSYWYDNYLGNPSMDVSVQMARTKVEERKEYRYGNLYNLCKFITGTLDTSKSKKGEPIILFPPNAYFRANGVDLFTMPDPSQFYYFTHMKSVWTTSPDVNKANWIVLPKGKNSLCFIPIQSDGQRRAMLDSFKRYKPTL
jgi:hypothetical protein